mmetsp:Transcript_8536/g.19106  ORF Transcript_8536/g.19106 Transcript_8536/m.19106 type:complete len:1257 (+) Transcript_8536:92-3862(+)
MPPNAPDGETRTSRIVGSVDFVRAKLPGAAASDDASSPSAALLTTVTGIRCSMPYTIKCASFAANPEEYDATSVPIRIEEIASNVFAECESKLSNFNANSEVNVVNGLGINDIHTCSDALSEVLMCSKELVKLTRGAFDPSVAPLLEYYEKMASRSRSSTSVSESSGSESNVATSETNNNTGDHVDVATIRRQRVVVDYWKSLLSAGFSNDPSDARVSRTVRRLLEVGQWSSAFSVGVVADNDKDGGGDLSTSTSSIKIRKKHVDARLDLSGIAKGWAVDKIADALPSPCYVEWGGDIKVRGKHPSGRPWFVAVPEPPTLLALRRRVAQAKRAGQVGPVFTLADEHRKEEEEDEPKGKEREYLAILELKDGEAVATSGDYEKVIERDGKLYSHVINPQLGRLLELNETTLAQAVVVAKSCMVADALATAAISKEDPPEARSMLDRFRTGYRTPVVDYLLYARYGPRIIRLSVPGIEAKSDRERRLQRHESATVIVVGSGLAGMSAAIEAADARAKVIILEKEPNTGGNSAKATSGISGWGTDTQAEQGVADEERMFERDTFRSGSKGQTDCSLVRTLSSKSADAIHWLRHRHGIPLTVLSQLGGHSALRTHRAPAVDGHPVPIGWKITKTLKDVIDIQYAGKIEVRCGMNVTKLLYHVGDNGRKTVTGVQVNGNESIEADGVVIATGGFGCCQSNDGLMGRFRPDLIGTATTNGAFAQGDGVVLGEALGAELIDMDKVQLHPTGIIDPKDPSNPTKFLAPEALRGSGGILVNSEGKRFVNELDLRSVVAAGIQNDCSNYKSDEYEGPPFAWCILSQQAQELFGKRAISFYRDTLCVFDECDNVKAICSLIGCKEEVLINTLLDYKEASKLGTCKQTHKDVFPSAITPESKDLVVARVTPSIHYTMGGLNINPAGEVQERVESIIGSHRHIRGLFAAGEVTGGVHGGNRLGGNSLLECVVFGRIAGQRAATVKHSEAVMFPRAQIDDGHTESNWVPVLLREVRNTDEKYGMNTREIRFNLHGSLQHSGMDIGQFIALRGQLDGETLMGYFSPITRPSDEGVIGILARSDEKGGPITRLLELSRPGSTFYMCAMGGLRLKFEPERIVFRGNEVRRIGLLAGGTGIAPMIQIIRAYGHYVRSHPGYLPSFQLNLIYAAEEMNDLAYMKILQTVRENIPRHFRFYVILNRPPLGWTEGVGFVERHDIVKHLIYPPTEGDLVVMCGPPVFEAAMRKCIGRLGFSREQWHSFAEGDNVSAHL